MGSIIDKTEDIKLLLTERNTKELKRIRYKSIDEKTLNEVVYCKEAIDEYNYYVKLCKRIKKYITSSSDLVFKVKHDRNNKLVCLIAYFDIEHIDIGMPVEIKLVVGDTKESYMKCFYYNNEINGKLYIKEFKAGKPRIGHGRIILENLDYIIKDINDKLDRYNHYNDEVEFNLISKIEGVAIPTKSIISQASLNNMYRKYGFNVDDKNNLEKLIKVV